MSASSPWFWLCSYPGKNTFQPDDLPLSLGDIYDTMQDEGLADVFVYDGWLMRHEFIEKFSAPDVLTHAAFDLQGQPLVFACINNRTGYSGLSHFCYFAAGKPYLDELAAEWFAMLADAGLRSLMGITPRPYRHAWKFALKQGYTLAGIVPGACVLVHHGGRVVDGVLTIKDLRPHVTAAKE